MVGVCKAESALFMQVFGGGEGAAPVAASGPGPAPAPAPAGPAGTVQGGAAGAATPPVTTHWVDAAQQVLSGMLESLCGLLSDLLRPLVLVLHDIDSLCELVHILSTEILSETVRRAGACVLLMLLCVPCSARS
jgi:hypothetical protein